MRRYNRTARTTPLDRALVSVIGLAMALSLLVGVVFVGYLLAGTLMVHASAVSFPYRFLSMNSDPVFTTLATVAGTTVAIGCMALSLLTLLSNDDSIDTGIVLFFALVGLGFSAGVVRMTATVTVRVLTHFVP